jgi:hypothetical protein
MLGGQEMSGDVTRARQSVGVAWWKLILREPALYFVVLGSAVFLLHRYVSSGRPSAGSGAASDTILISAEVIRGLRESWLQKTGSHPDPHRLDEMIGNLIADEVLYREARRLGLDERDTIVRRRLTQKMQFLIEDLGVQGQATEVELQEFLDRHQTTFLRPGRVTLTQVFLGRPHARSGGDERARRVLEMLRHGTISIAEARRDSPPSLLPGRMVSVSELELSKRFGPELARAVFSQPLGRWSGPVRSTYGLHLVELEKQTPGRPARLGEVREQVREGLLAERRKLARQARLAALRQRYRVRIEAGPASAQALAKRNQPGERVP